MAYGKNNPHKSMNYSSKKKAPKRPFRKVKNKKDSYMSKMDYGLSDYDRKIKFNDTELPGGKDWEIGKTYKLEVEVKMTGRVDEEGQKPVSTYQVMGVKDIS